MLPGLCNKWPRASLAALIIYGVASDGGRYSIILKVVSLPSCNGYRAVLALVGKERLDLRETLLH